MHDPKTVAHDIFPSFQIFGRWFRPPRFITIWHVDPETDGTDNSCDWFGTKMPEANGWFEAYRDDLENLPEDAQKAVRFLWYKFHSQLAPRPWYRHPRWHVHHWQIQIIPLQRFKRFVFSRCQVCGKRFSWHDSAGHVIGSWNNDGPGWKVGAERISHIDCYNHKAVKNSETVE